MEKPKARLTLQQHQQAINEAIWIDASPHEWPTVDKMWLLCSALIDSVRMVDYLRIRLAAVEAERDAARATYTCFHCGFASADEAEATAHFGDRDEEMPLCRWWHESTDAERAQELQSKILELTSVTDERDNALRYTELLIAAQAGEARAVKFASTVKSTIEESLEYCKQDSEVSIELLKDLMNQADGIGYAHELGNALDWLAQQRREAAAEENERWANEWWELARPSSLTASDFIARAAALRAGEVGE